MYVLSIGGYVITFLSNNYANCVKKEQSVKMQSQMQQSIVSAELYSFTRVCL